MLEVDIPPRLCGAMELLCRKYPPLRRSGVLIMPIYFSCHLDSRTVQYRIGREEHIQRKIDLMVTEAKTKMAKKDKKGEW